MCTVNTRTYSFFPQGSMFSGKKQVNQKVENYLNGLFVLLLPKGVENFCSSDYE